MFQLSPINKIIVITIACLCFAILLVRLFLNWRRNRQFESQRSFRRRVDQTPVADLAERTASTVGQAASNVADKATSMAAATTGAVASVAKSAGAAIDKGLKSIHEDDELAPLRPRTSSQILKKSDSAVVTASAMAGAAQKREQVRLAAGAVPIDFDELPDADGSDYVLGGLTPILADMLPESDDRRRSITKSLKNAGYFGRHAWHNLAAIRYLGVFVPLIVALLALIFVIPPEYEMFGLLAVVGLPILGWTLPTLIVRSQASARLREIGNAMPDMLDILNMCVSQGMTVPTALGRVANDLEPVYPSLSKELKIVTEQSRVGTLQQALQGFSDRCDIPEVHSFTSLLVQTEKMGTSVSEALVEYSDNMRESMRQRADGQANTAQFKLLFPTVFCLMPAVYLFLLGPAIVELSNFFNQGGRDLFRNGGQVVRDVQQTRPGTAATRLNSNRQP